MKYLRETVTVIAIVIIIGSLLFIGGCTPPKQTPDIETPRIGVEVQYFVVDGKTWMRFVPPGSSMECIQRRDRSMTIQCVPLKQAP